MQKDSRTIIIAIILLLALAIIGWIYYLRQFRNQEERTPQENQGQGQEIEIVQENLNVPWEIVFGPENEIYLTERTGNLKIIREKNVTTIPIENVKQIGEGGLLGLALHPSFTRNRQIYLYKTTEQDGNLNNVVERYVLENSRLINREVILDNIPAFRIHDGGRIAFGPDNFLYVTTGDAGQSNLAQDTNSLAGKILRVTEKGDSAPGNPFNNPIYSFGHRNPEGLAWDDKGRLWATEHGSSANDELNLIEIGKNYGWPLVQGSQAEEGMISPVITSGGETWAPAGLAYLAGKLYWGGLRGSALYSVQVTDSRVESLKKDFSSEYGRIRAVVVKGDELYFSTSNRDSRGIPKLNDDKIVKIKP